MKFHEILEDVLISLIISEIISWVKYFFITGGIQKPVDGWSLGSSRDQVIHGDRVVLLGTDCSITEYNCR